MNTKRAALYVQQALGRLAELERTGSVPPSQQGTAVSLRRNLESALADLKEPTDNPQHGGTNA